MFLRSIFAFFIMSLLSSGADLRVGIIGTDTSHVSVFTKMLNDASSPDHVPGARVVAAFKGGSRDVESSWSRVDKYAEEIKTAYGVEIVPDILSLLSKVDAVLLESVDGRPHLEQAKPVIAAKKPLFIDKPLAASMKDVLEIARLAKQAGTPWWSTSALRYGDVANSMKFADATGAITWGPGPFEAHHELELAWYGIHPIEMLFVLLGPGCEEVTRRSGETSDEITCRWKDGRIGTVRALRPYGDFGAVVFRPKDVVVSPAKTKFSYGPLVRDIVKFFQTGKPPVPNEETLEIYAFIHAAQRSKEAGGAPVKLILP